MAGVAASLYTNDEGAGIIVGGTEAVLLDDEPSALAHRFEDIKHESLDVADSYELPEPDGMCVDAGCWCNDIPAGTIELRRGLGIQGEAMDIGLAIEISSLYTAPPFVNSLGLPILVLCCLVGKPIVCFAGVASATAQAASRSASARAAAARLPNDLVFPRRIGVAARGAPKRASSGAGDAIAANGILEGVSAYAAGRLKRDTAAMGRVLMDCQLVLAHGDIAAAHLRSSSGGRESGPFDIFGPPRQANR